MARANVLGALRGKRAKIHRGSRRRNIKPHQEAEYTSAVATVDLKLSNPLQSGGVHIRPHTSGDSAFWFSGVCLKLSSQFRI